MAGPPSQRERGPCSSLEEAPDETDDPRSLEGGALALVLSLASLPALAAEVLPSWNDGVAKARILAFVRAVTEPGGKDFVPPAERIAVFDNDGTLWSEQPMYFQLAFAIDRVKALAPQHPSGRRRSHSRPPWKAT